MRDLVAFVLHSGDLGGNGRFQGPGRAIEGTRGHQRLQKNRPQGYEAEVVVSREIEREHFVLSIKGRIDGVLHRDGSLLIEEIKTVDEFWNGEAHPLHWAQAKIYGALHASAADGKIETQLTYLPLDSNEVTVFRESHSLADLQNFFTAVVEEYLGWIEDYCAWCNRRDVSIEAISFPFDRYRAGQRSLAVAVYRTIARHGRLFVEAPTGIGKTISALFPSIKALPSGAAEKIFYVTAKTIGRTVAEKALADLRGAGLRLRSITLTARDKICFNNGRPCDVKTCPFALGYYDRIKPALQDGLKSDELTRSEVERLARKHQVCPFELSLDLSVWCDAVVCDYNYVFDPTVSLKRFFSDEERQYAILIDEAHNLADRAREMFSAELSRPALADLKNAMEESLPACARILGRICGRMSALNGEAEFVEKEGAFVSKALPAKIGPLVKNFVEEAEGWLARNEPSGFREALLEGYFQALAYLRVSEWFGERYATIYEAGPGRLRLFCLDPAPPLKDILTVAGSAVFFSATLRPIDYFREVLGAEAADPYLALSSPFRSENLCVLVQANVSTRLRARESSYEAVAASIGAVARARRGNYLVYFSSYEYLNQVFERFRALFPEMDVHRQNPAMTETARSGFLDAFKEAGALLGFAVLGGIFGEGIDLVGERLIGVVVVGVGLPQICVERDLIREYREERGGRGFDYAYTFPGMNRVLQAAGRLIRTESDRGVVLLIDDRFGRPLHRRLFPEWWRPQFVATPAQISARAEEFWQSDSALTSEQRIPAVLAPAPGV